MDMPDKIWVCKDISDHGSNYIATPNASETVKLLRTPYTRTDIAQSLADALEGVIASTKSHVDGRDLLDELHPRNTLDIKRRVDGIETWFEGDWLSNLRAEIKTARAALANYRRGE